MVFSNSKETVAGVSEARHDVTVPVEFSVNGGGKNREQWIAGANAADAFGGRDEIDQPDAPGAQFREQLHGGNSAAAGREHGVDQDYFESAEVAGKALVVE